MCMIYMIYRYTYEQNTHTYKTIFFKNVKKKKTFLKTEFTTHTRVRARSLHARLLRSQPYAGSGWGTVGGLEEIS